MTAGAGGEGWAGPRLLRPLLLVPAVAAAAAAAGSEGVGAGSCLMISRRSGAPARESNYRR